MDDATTKNVGNDKGVSPWKTIAPPQPQSLAGGGRPAKRRGDDDGCLTLQRYKRLKALG